MKSYRIVTTTTDTMFIAEMIESIDMIFPLTFKTTTGKIFCYNPNYIILITEEEVE